MRVEFPGVSMIHKPLDRFELFRSRDLDVTRDTVAGVFCDHRLALVGRDARLDARMNARRLDNVGFTYIAYGEAVQVDPGELEHFYVVQVPLAGCGTYRYGARSVGAGPGAAVVVGPLAPLHMRLSAELELVIVRIERTALEATLADLIDRPLPAPIEFSLGMKLAAGYARTWCDYLRFCVTELDRPDSLLAHPLSLHHMEQNLISGLLLAQDNNYSDTLEGKALPAPSRAIARAVDVVENHPEIAHTMGSLAKQAGVSVRALQKGFRKHLDTTPSAFLRAVRLQRAHDELKAAQADTVTVGEVAGRWGFMHLGRFATAYRHKFNETPSQTLHR
ncbi:helix-turn-helix protein [Prauserella muralis]|nr:helix-turn-helix protein [Prauserella muralis]